MGMYTVIGVWMNDEPVPVGVVEGDHTVVGGAGDRFPEGLWATSVDAANPNQAEVLAKQEMREDDE